MKNTWGQSVAVTLFGESHGEEIGVVLDGLAPGIPVDEGFIAAQLTKRRPWGTISTARQEADSFRLVSGVFHGKTTGTPLCILIPNTCTRSADYEETRDLARPGHADYTAQCKYHGCQDYRGGGHFSGRLTAPLVAAGAIALTALGQKGIAVGTHMAACGGITDRPFDRLEEDIARLNGLAFPVLDQAQSTRMLAAIEAAAAEGDSVGGVLETAVTGLPAGVGEPFFDSVESLLSHGLFAIPAIKGVEFGDGFALAAMRGSRANDPFRMEGDRVVTVTNRSGGINGGITNGMPVVFRTAVKPTPSIYKPQDTVDMRTGENKPLQITGRHDPAIVHRVRVVQDSITALILTDMLACRYGTDFFAGE